MKKRSLVKGLCLGLSAMLLMGIGSPMTVEAAKKKPAVKTVSLLVGGKKVNSKTVTVKKGSTTKVTVKVNPSNAKKSVKYKTSSKKIATVSKGKVKARKNGTAKITISVKGKNGKTKNVWLKVKVVTTLPKPAAKPAPQPSKPVVQPSKPSTPSTPSQPTQPTQPSKPENPSVPSGSDESSEPTDHTANANMKGYELLRKLDYSKLWMNCEHQWSLKHSETRTTCNYCLRDEGKSSDIYFAHDDSGFEHGSNNHGGYHNGMNNFYVCSKCSACWKHTQSMSNPNSIAAGLNRIYPSYEEAYKNDNPDVTVMMSGYNYADCPKPY